MADTKPLKVTPLGEISRFEETDVIPATHGGTGTSSLSQLLTNILPDQTSHAGDILTAVGDGSVEWTAVTSTQGFTGSRGDIGFTGSASIIAGPAGFTGSAGVNGADGATGFTGSQGATGFTGSQGATGFTGSQGATGFTGSGGFTGSAGATGFTGSTSYATISDIAPSPTIGKLWFDSTTGKLKIWYDDGSSTQWVDATPAMMGYTGSAGAQGPSGASGMPAGAVSFFATAAAPAGWLIANGQTVSRTTYASLFAAIGTMYGAGDGLNTFAVPDLRGEFLRGADLGRGVDPGRSLGSGQADELRAHSHAYNGGVLIGMVTGATTLYANSGGVTAATGGAETRPRNIAMLPCICTGN